MMRPQLDLNPGNIYNLVISGEKNLKSLPEVDNEI